MGKKHALVLDPMDNVATLLADAAASETITLKGIEGTIKISENIAVGHKVSLTSIEDGQDIIKYGHRIGIATKDITRGEWVHLHNMTSTVDLTFKKRVGS